MEIIIFFSHCVYKCEVIMAGTRLILGPAFVSVHPSLKDDFYHDVHKNVVAPITPKIHQSSISINICGFLFAR